MYALVWFTRLAAAAVWIVDSGIAVFVIPAAHSLTYCKSHGPLSPHAIKYLALAFINGVQKRGRDYDTSAADCTVIVGH